MARMGSFDISGMKKLQRNLNKIQEQQVNEFVEECAKELAARLLAKVIKRTPVGNYSKEVEVTAKRDSKKHKKGDTYKKRINPTGKMGGTLRRGWISKTQEEAESKKRSTIKNEEILDYVDEAIISHTGNLYTIEIINPVEYASYVEYGHRQTPGRYVPGIGKRLKHGWAQGLFMMTISEQEIQKIAPKVLEKKIKKFLGGAFNGQ